MSKFWDTRKIYLTIITAGFDWKSHVEEIRKLKVEEAALFLTGIGCKERKSLFNEIENSSLKKIPFVHLRSDMKLEEVDYLVEKWGTKKFNIHPSSDTYPQEFDLSRHNDKIYVENSTEKLKGVFLEEEDLKGFAGVCVDVAHLADEKQISTSHHEKTLKIIKKYEAGCNHISPHKLERTDKIIKGEKVSRGSPHRLENTKELEYLKTYPSWIFSDTIALEMTNSIKKQMQAREYIIDLLKDKE